jgi:hypothetical protein
MTLLARRRPRQNPNQEEIWIVYDLYRRQPVPPKTMRTAFEGAFGHAENKPRTYSTWSWRRTVSLLAAGLNPVFVFSYHAGWRGEELQASFFNRL